MASRYPPCRATNPWLPVCHRLLTQAVPGRCHPVPGAAPSPAPHLLHPLPTHSLPISIPNLMLATAGPGLFPQLAAPSLKFRAVKRREKDRRDLGPGCLLTLQHAAWELFALLAHTPEPAGFPKIALWYSCRRLCVLGSSPGGSQRGLEASGGALVAGGRSGCGMGAPLPSAGLGALAAVSAEERFVPFPGMSCTSSYGNRG